MIHASSLDKIPPVKQPITKRRPESAFARREVQAYLNSGHATAEIINIPLSYDVQRLYGALQNAVWSLCDRPREVRVIKRGERLFLTREEPA